MTSVPTGKCGPCCSVAANGSTAIHRTGPVPAMSGQWMSVQSRGGSKEVIERNVSLDGLALYLYSVSARAFTSISLISSPIMGQNDRPSPTMNPALLLPALTPGLVAAVMAIPSAGAQTTLDKVSFGTNWVAEAEHG